MTLGSVTKLGKRNKKLLKEIDDDVMSAYYDVIVIFPIYGYNPEGGFQEYSHFNLLIVIVTYIFNFQTTYGTRKGNFSVLEYEPLKSPPRLRLAEIIPILLILRHIIDRSWKPLETKSWKPIKTNSDKKMLVSEKELSNFKFKRFKKYWCKLKIT